ncbi:MAG: tetratricopeptide repeat protein [Nitrospirae bacterium]|nr:MAG: tetratricopeptide repeat protein [Nitrospirota bacterium]
MQDFRSAYYNQVGNEYFSRGLYTIAYRYYLLALQASRRSGDPRALLATLGNLGNICAVSGHRDQARTYYQAVLDLQKFLGDQSGIAATLANLGNLSVDAGEWERGRAYYLEALDLMGQGGNELARAILLSNLGLVEKETGQFARAADYYARAFSLMRRVGNLAGQADVQQMLAKMYLSQQRFDEALACVHASLAIAQQLNDELRMGGAWYVMAGCYEAKGDIAQAVQSLQHVVRIDQMYGLPKLSENQKRLHNLLCRLSNLSSSSCPQVLS